MFAGGCCPRGSALFGGSGADVAHEDLCSSVVQELAVDWVDSEVV